MNISSRCIAQFDQLQKVSIHCIHFEMNHFRRAEAWIGIFIFFCLFACYAAIEFNEDIFKLLLHKGADMEAVNALTGRTPLYWIKQIFMHIFFLMENER